MTAQLESGEDYIKKLNNETNLYFNTFLSMLSSYWKSTIDGPNYARELKSMSLSLAKLRLSLEQVRSDTFYDQTRGEFLYQVVTNLLFPKEIPGTNLSDTDFKGFIQKVLMIYFNGSIPSSMEKAVKLFMDGEVSVKENYVQSGSKKSGFDISDQFGFTVNVIVNSKVLDDLIVSDKNVRILLDIIKPAHVLYKIKYIFKDMYVGNETADEHVKVKDSLAFVFSSYTYDDFRKFTNGLYRIDRLGSKKSVKVLNERHIG